jgi:hypothetical protein
MSTNAHVPCVDQALMQVINRAIAVGGANSTTNLVYPDGPTLLWIKACVAAGSSVGQPGCPHVGAGEYMKAALGA